MTLGKPRHRLPPLALAAAVLATAAAHGADHRVWQSAGEADGVQLAYHDTPTGYRAYRGATRVCTHLAALQTFVGDAERLPEWIPFTEAARALPAPGPDELYYLRTRTPWPLQSRDMVYRLEALPPVTDGTVRIAISGEPDALPPQQGAVRMEAAEGLWTLHADGTGIAVTLRMEIDPGGAPTFFANRRLAATVAGMLANLRARFPCDDREAG